MSVIVSQGVGLLEGGLAFRESSKVVSSWPGSVSTAVLRQRDLSGTLI